MIVDALSFALMQKKQKIKDNPNGSARLSRQRHHSSLLSTRDITLLLRVSTVIYGNSSSYLYDHFSKFSTCI